MEITNYHQDENDQEKAKKKKKRSRGMHVINVFLYMLRRRRRKPWMIPGFWRRLLESLRQLNKPPPPSADITIMPSSDITTMPLPEKEAAAAHDGGDDVVEQISETVGAFTAASSSSSSSYGISAYGSAMSLLDMDNDDDGDDGDDDDDECYYGSEGGDEMIDVKAEEFIAKFYEEIRMQNEAYAKRYKSKRVSIDQ